MATMKELLEEEIAEVIAEDGPDSPLVKHLQTQLASLGTIRGPSELAVLNPSKEQSVSQSIAEKSRLISARSNAADDEPAVGIQQAH